MSTGFPVAVVERREYRPPKKRSVLSLQKRELKDHVRKYSWHNYIQDETFNVVPPSGSVQIGKVTVQGQYEFLKEKFGGVEMGAIDFELGEILVDSRKNGRFQIRKKNDSRGKGENHV